MPPTNVTWSADSRRGYVSVAEVNEYAGLSLPAVTDEDDSSYLIISKAEEMIDAYVGWQEKFFPLNLRGQVTAQDGQLIYDTSQISQVVFPDGFYIGVEIEIIGGTGNGQRRIIQDSFLTNKQLVVLKAWTVEPDETSFFHLYQLGKFPRVKDVFINPVQTRYYKSIPEMVKRATAAQVAYMQNMGDNFFETDAVDINSQRIGNYSETKATGNTTRLLAPKARQFLTEIKNQGGRVVADNPTWL